MSPCRICVPPGQRNQRGVATILILLLVALAVTVTVLIVAYSLRGNQQRQLTVHSTTAAQGAAWRGVEVLRTGLVNVDAVTVGKWSQGDSTQWNETGVVIPASGTATNSTSTSQGGGATSAAPVALTSANWNDASIAGLCDSSPATGVINVNGLASLGVSRARLVEVCRVNGSIGVFRVTAQVTGTAGEGSALTTSTVEVVYNITPGMGGNSGTCASLPPALMVFNGDLNITGGSLGVTDGTVTNYENIAVAGNMTMSNAGQARVSGCAKGNIDVNGGGVSANGYLHAEGTVNVHGSSPPQGTSLWGRSVTLDGSASGARYSEIKAGAYATAVMVDGQIVGSTNVGGTLVASTVTGGIPWTTGLVVPNSNSSKFVVTLADGSIFVVDPGKLTVDHANGVVSGAEAASERLSGSGTMPSGFTLRAGSIFGGGITAEGLATTTLVWGHDVSLGLSPGNDLTGQVDVGTLSSNGNLKLGNGRIAKLSVGGTLWAPNAQYDYNEWSAWSSNFPVVSDGKVAGEVFHRRSPHQLREGASIAGFNVQRNQAGTSPGLPGIPFCDARVKAVDAEAYKSQANYIFEFRGGVPVLTIRNVKTAAGASIDGTYNLATQDVRTMPLGGEPFLACSSLPDSHGNGHCKEMQAATPLSGWTFTDIVSFPRGVVWFDGAVTINGSDKLGDLINTIAGTGKVTLTSYGHGDLVAPNFSTPALVCGGNFWPTNLCDKSGSIPAFVTWKDAENKTRVGLPIGNVAIATEGGGQLSGWNIHGSVILGGGLETAANVTVVQGTITVGANQPGSTTLINQGGARVSVPTSSDQLYLPVCEAPTSIPAVDGRVQWSRYL